MSAQKDYVMQLSDRAFRMKGRNDIVKQLKFIAFGGHKNDITDKKIRCEKERETKRGRDRNKKRELDRKR